jgi:hypothetical protein
MNTFYGFSVANYEGKPAWFHTLEAAQRFADACGFPMSDIETTESAQPQDILDTQDEPWNNAG